jgi:hypothetical protein
MKDHSDQQTIDVATAVRLLAPREVGITLVPLSEVEEAESFAFWTTIFISVLTTIGGTLLGLLASGYSNAPVLYLLLFFGVVFLLISAAFGLKVRRIRLSARERTLNPALRKQEILQRAQQILHVAQNYEMMTKVRRLVFREGTALDESDYRERLRWLVSEPISDEFLTEFADAVIDSGIVERFLGPDGRSFAKINEEYWPDGEHLRSSLLSESLSQDS